MLLIVIILQIRDAKSCKKGLCLGMNCNCCQTPICTNHSSGIWTLSEVEIDLLYTSPSSISPYTRSPLNTHPLYVSSFLPPYKSRIQCHTPEGKTTKSVNCSASQSKHCKPMSLPFLHAYNTSKTPFSSQTCHISSKSPLKMHMLSKKSTSTPSNTAFMKASQSHCINTSLPSDWEFCNRTLPLILFHLHCQPILNKAKCFSN